MVQADLARLLLSCVVGEHARLCSLNPRCCCSDTLGKLLAKNPQGRVNFAERYWLTHVDMAASRQEEAWLHIEGKHLSVD